MADQCASSSGTDLDLDKLEALARDAKIGGSPVQAMKAMRDLQSALPADTVLQLIETARRASPQPVAVDEQALYHAALLAVERMRGCAATYIEDHAKDAYPGSIGLRPQDVATMWAKEIHGIDAKAYLDEAIDDLGAQHPSAAPSEQPAEIDDAFAQGMLVELARRGASANGIALAAQLFGVGPCSDCGYRKMHCRCINPVPHKSGVAPSAQIADDHAGDERPQPVFLKNLHYFFGQTDGSYAWPAGSVGDLLRQAKREIEATTQPPTAPVLSGDLHIGVANNDQGVHISIMQRHADGSATLIYSAKAPAGDSYGRAALAQQAATCQPAQQAEKISCPECSGTGGVMMAGDCTDCNGKGYDWEPAEIAAPVPVAAEDARDAEMLNHMEAWLTKSKARGFAWNSYDFSTDKTVRKQIRAAMSSASANGGKDGE